MFSDDSDFAPRKSKLSQKTSPKKTTTMGMQSFKSKVRGMNRMNINNLLKSKALSIGKNPHSKLSIQRLQPQTLKHKCRDDEGDSSYCSSNETSKKVGLKDFIQIQDSTSSNEDCESDDNSNITNQITNKQQADHLPSEKTMNIYENGERYLDRNVETVKKPSLSVSSSNKCKVEVLSSIIVRSKQSLNKVEVSPKCTKVPSSSEPGYSKVSSCDEGESDSEDVVEDKNVASTIIAGKTKRSDDEGQSSNSESSDSDSVSSFHFHIDKDIEKKSKAQFSARLPAMSEEDETDRDEFQGRNVSNSSKYVPSKLTHQIHFNYVTTNNLGLVRLDNAFNISEISEDEDIFFLKVDKQIDPMSLVNYGLTFERIQNISLRKAETTEMLNCVVEFDKGDKEKLCVIGNSSGACGIRHLYTHGSFTINTQQQKAEVVTVVESKKEAKFMLPKENFVLDKKSVKILDDLIDHQLSNFISDCDSIGQSSKLSYKKETSEYVDDKSTVNIKERPLKLSECGEQSQVVFGDLPQSTITEKVMKKDYQKEKIDNVQAGLDKGETIDDFLNRSLEKLRKPIENISEKSPTVNVVDNQNKFCTSLKNITRLHKKSKKGNKIIGNDQEKHVKTLNKIRSVDFENNETNLSTKSNNMVKNEDKISKCEKIKNYLETSSQDKNKAGTGNNLLEKRTIDFENEGKFNQTANLDNGTVVHSGQFGSPDNFAKKERTRLKKSTSFGNNQESQTIGDCRAAVDPGNIYPENMLTNANKINKETLSIEESRNIIKNLKLNSEDSKIIENLISNIRNEYEMKLEAALSGISVDSRKITKAVYNHVGDSSNKSEKISNDANIMTEDPSQFKRSQKKIDSDIGNVRFDYLVDKDKSKEELQEKTIVSPELSSMTETTKKKRTKHNKEQNISATIFDDVDNLIESLHKKDKESVQSENIVKPSAESLTGCDLNKSQLKIIKRGEAHESKKHKSSSLTDETKDEGAQKKLKANRKDQKNNNLKETSKESDDGTDMVVKNSRKKKKRKGKTESNLPSFEEPPVDFTNMKNSPKHKKKLEKFEEGTMEPFQKSKKPKKQKEKVKFSSQIKQIFIIPEEVPTRKVSPSAKKRIDSDEISPLENKKLNALMNSTMYSPSVKTMFDPNETAISPLKKVKECRALTINAGDSMKVTSQSSPLKQMKKRKRQLSRNFDQELKVEENIASNKLRKRRMTLT